MLGGISSETGLTYSSVSFAIAIGQLVFGISQPIFGILSLKKTKKFVLILGCLLMALGIGMIPLCSSTWMLMLSLGVLLATGTGAVSFGMIMGVVTASIGEEKAVMVTGFVNASSGVGSVILSPVIQNGFRWLGVKHTLTLLSLFILLLVPASIIVSKKEKMCEYDTAKSSVIPVLKGSFCNKNYWCLFVGFFTCGFHMATIETHLFSQITAYGISETVTAAFFSVYGFATIIGPVMSGILCKKLPMKYVLGALYGSRVVLVGVFLILPKNAVIICLIMVLLGITGASTLTPTSGLASKLFGAENLATLFGTIFLGHQIGSFFSAWIGGVCLEKTGNYFFVWGISMLLSGIAAVVSCNIDDERSSL